MIADRAAYDERYSYSLTDRWLE